ILTGNNSNIINIPVTNRKTGENFQVFKKGEDGKPLQGASFKITKQVKEGETGYTAEKTSDTNGIVNFDNDLTEGTYIIEETKAPNGYNKLDQKWVLVIDKEGKKKIYNYSSRTDTDEKSLLGEEGTYIVNVKDRPQIGWGSFDNRNTGWAGNNTNAEHLGTRIIAINKDKKYVIQRYVLNPEAKQLDGITSATIHREKPNYPNMDWYNGEEYKVFTLAPKEGADTDGKVTGLISDLRLSDYNVTDITEAVKKTAEADSTSHYGETRLKLSIPKTNKPIIIDVKIPYKNENGGVGTGMDWRESGVTYWKSDYYERVSDIVLGDSFQSEVGSIKGSYIGENSLDVINEAKTFGFKIKKVKEGATDTVIPGAKFKLTGPDEFIKEMTTGSNGIISFDGLKPGEYTLKETQPAPGYNKTESTWTVRIADDGKAFIKENTTKTGPQNPENNLEIVP
ncbi:MAG: prealbumin-like fold domain-containing protein, partial [Anaerococcus obesiensis]